MRPAPGHVRSRIILYGPIRQVVTCILTPPHLPLSDLCAPVHHRKPTTVFYQCDDRSLLAVSENIVVYLFRLVNADRMQRGLSAGQHPHVQASNQLAGRGGRRSQFLFSPPTELRKYKNNNNNFSNTWKNLVVF